MTPIFNHLFQERPCKHPADRVIADTVGRGMHMTPRGPEDNERIIHICLNCGQEVPAPIVERPEREKDTEEIPF